MNIRARIYGGADAAEEPILKAKQPKGAKADTLHSVSVARETRQRSDSRGEDRHRLSGERARVSHDGKDHEVELINLSGGGAMIAAGFEPMLWDAVEMHLGEHGTIECVVRWIRDGRIGLEFAHETRLDCSADEVATVLREVISRSFPDLVLLEEEPEDDEIEIEEDENRTASRHPLIWNAVLHHDYQSTKVRVRNISPTGAMIESAVPVRTGTQPLLEITESVSLSATVAWVVGDQVGLTFHTPFDMRALAQAKPTVAAAEWLKPDYLGGGADNDDENSPWDPRWKRMTLVELQQELEGFLKH